MKKNFENFYPIYIIAFLFLVFVIISLSLLANCFYKEYYITQASITDFQQLTMILDSKILNQLNKNKTIYVEGKKKHISIQKVYRDFVVRNKKNYHQVVVLTKLDTNKPLLDTVTVTIYQKKRSLYTMLETCWKGEKNAENKSK